MDVVVVGSGGNGQTYFMNFLNNNKIKTNSIIDKDKLKHTSNPSLVKKKCIFLYNHPLDSVISHFRRNWAYNQIKKLGNPNKLKNIENINYFFGLAKKKKCDLFGIHYQFDRWINAQNKFPILFLNFNDILIDENKTILNEFVGKELNYSNFVVKKRNSSELNIDKDVIEIYEKLYDYMNKKSNEHNKF